MVNVCPETGILCQAQVLCSINYNQPTPLFATARPPLISSLRPTAVVKHRTGSLTLYYWPIKTTQRAFQHEQYIVHRVTQCNYANNY